MVLKIDTLIKCILLLHRENLVRTDNPELIDSSGDLIKTILNMYRNSRKVLITTENTIVDDLKELVIAMINNPENYDESLLVQQLTAILSNNESILNSITKSLTTEITQQGLRRSIVTLRNFLNNHYKE